jgi:hypothetical protein
MLWNLVDNISPSNGPRRFFLPLNDLLDEATLSFSEDPPESRVSDAVLAIKVHSPAGGFTPVGDLINPLIRLHAIDRAQVRFVPADAVLRDRLVLTCITFARSVFGPGIFEGFPRWWDRWQEAGCVPLRVTYENVDATSIRSLLTSVKAPADDTVQSHVLPTNGINFPSGVFDGMSKTLFIDNFMLGSDGYFVLADSGSYLGAVAPDPDDTSPEPSRLLKLHVEYSDHEVDSPHPMNPREFFYLLFGNDSKEAKDHPLLKKLDQASAAQTGHESKSMRLRPPFRTHARVLWEADLELPNPNDPTHDHSKDWTQTGSCKERLYNDHERDGRRFNRAPYNDCRDSTGKVVGCWKCNLFVLDIVMRSGFRVPIHPVGSTVWHYVDPQWMAQRVDGVSIQDGNDLLDRAPLVGKIGNSDATWGFKIEGSLRSGSPTADELRAKLNEATSIEGRCLIVPIDYVIGFSGHMVIVDRVMNVASVPLDFAGVGHGFNSLAVYVREAGSSGGAKRGAALVISAATKMELVHIVELHPGRDPDTPLGLRDCNVQF